MHIFQEWRNIWVAKLLTTSNFGGLLVANNITILKLAKKKRWKQKSDNQVWPNRTQTSLDMTDCRNQTHKRKITNENRQHWKTNLQLITYNLYLIGTKCRLLVNMLTHNLRFKFYFLNVHKKCKHFSLPLYYNHGK